MARGDGQELTQTMLTDGLTFVIRLGKIYLIKRH